MSVILPVKDCIAYNPCQNPTLIVSLGCGVNSTLLSIAFAVNPALVVCIGFAVNSTLVSVAFAGNPTIDESVGFVVNPTLDVS